MQTFETMLCSRFFVYMTSAQRRRHRAFFIRCQRVKCDEVSSLTQNTAERAPTNYYRHTSSESVCHLKDTLCALTFPARRARLLFGPLLLSSRRPNKFSQIWITQQSVSSEAESCTGHCTRITKVRVSMSATGERDQGNHRARSQVCYRRAGVCTGWSVLYMRSLRWHISSHANANLYAEGQRCFYLLALCTCELHYSPGIYEK